ncbi:hypothetical protein ABZP36_027556 [Zizania latifolia]
MDTLRGLRLPPGFGFHPKDTELISHYLKKKILGQQIEYEIIPEVDIYKHEPWDLPAKCNVPTQDNKWHFFASRDRKYPNGSRSNRATIAGYWKSTGKDRNIQVDKRTIGMKKTLVFHEGRPPSGRRTEWIMHEYYIAESECQACPDMKDAFVLCRVTKRNDWTSENGNKLDNSDRHTGQPNAAGTSVINTEEQDAAAALVVAEQQNHAATQVTVVNPHDDVTPSDITADIGSPDGIDIEEWLNELIDPYFNPEQASADLSPDEQNAESSNLAAVAPKVEPNYCIPNENVVDDTEYLRPEDFYGILYPGTDDFNMLVDPIDHAAFALDYQTYHNIADNCGNGTRNEELQSPQDNNEPTQSNEAADNGIIVRRRHGKTPAASMTPITPYRARLQHGMNKMVTSNSESINQTIKFENNRGRLVEHQKRRALDATYTKRSEAAGKELSNRGFLRGIRKAAFAGCSEAGSNIIIRVIFMIGVAALVYHVGHRLGFNQQQQQYA